MEFSIIDQKSIIKVLDFVIKSDNHIDTNEIGYLAEICAFYGFDDSILIDLEHISLTESIQRIDAMDAEKKSFVVNAALGQAQSDNNISKSEKEFLDYLKSKVGVKKK